jgi:hypothetical protein
MSEIYYNFTCSLILLHIHCVFIVIVLYKSLPVDNRTISIPKTNQVSLITHNISQANYQKGCLIDIKCTAGVFDHN